MKGANMFVIYADSSGSNITLSSRLGFGHFEPEYTETTQVSLLEGTGIDGDTMTANIRCKPVLHFPSAKGRVF